SAAKWTCWSRPAAVARCYRRTHSRPAGGGDAAACPDRPPRDRLMGADAMPTTENASLPFVDTGAYPTRAGNHIRPWIDGEPAFRRICDAIEAATHSAWATITFMWPSFQMPNDRGSALDVLERAARRGVDVRLICWRPDEETAEYRRNAFWGSAEHFALLADRYPHLNIRWDRAQPGYCQHQKTWLIDAGHEHATCFAGGINLNPHSVVMPGHRGEGQNHDVYVELAG